MDDNRKTIEIEIWIDATLDIRGQSFPTLQPLSYYNESAQTSGTMKEIRKESDIGPEVAHVYFVTNKGPSTIKEAEVFILWPLTSLGGEDLLYLMEQPITKGDVKCDHVQFANYRKIKSEATLNTLWERYNIDISAFNAANAQKVSKENGNEHNIEIGTGINSGIGVINKPSETEQEIKKAGGDSSSVWAHRHNESTSEVSSWGTLNPYGQYELTVSKSFT
ncbi:integrin alpha-PS2-like, partial [Diabrotica undecimpunctata]